MDKLVELELKLARGLEVAFFAERGQLAHVSGRRVRRDGNNAERAHSHSYSSKAVVAAVKVETDVVADFRRVLELVDVAARFLDANEPVYLCEAGDGLRSDVDARARRHVVDYDRKLGGFGYRLIVLDDAVLRAFVVIRRDDERAVRAERLDGGGFFRGGRGAVAARADYDGHAMRDLFYNELGRFFILVVRYRGGFARRAEGEQGGNAV